MLQPTSTASYGASQRREYGRGGNPPAHRVRDSGNSCTELRACATESATLTNPYTGCALSPKRREEEDEEPAERNRRAARGRHHVRRDHMA